MYTVDYFIKKFEAIPESGWCISSRAKSEFQRCALGWCYPDYASAKKSEEGWRNEDSDEDKALVALFIGSLPYILPAGVNNGIYTEYPQPTPKQRILAALYDIKKMQQPQYEDVTKSLAVLPVSETSDLIKQPQPCE